MYRLFLKPLFVLFVLLISAPGSFAQSDEKDLYEIKVYHLKDKAQEERIDEFLEQAYLPALNRAGTTKVGVFKPVEGDSLAGKRIYVFIPYSSANEFIMLPQILEKDESFLKDGKGYIEAPHNDPPYLRMESILLQAFEGWPRFRSTDLKGAVSERVYELRSYESATEDLFKNKVRMFNEGEIEIFDRLKFNPVFFGEVLAGSHMPNLMYMTAFPDMESRNEHWESFGEDAAWGKMSSLEEYQNNVSHIDVFLLTPTSYSKI